MNERGMSHGSEVRSGNQLYDDSQRHRITGNLHMAHVRGVDVEVPWITVSSARRH